MAADASSFNVTTAFAGALGAQDSSASHHFSCNSHFAFELDYSDATLKRQT